MGADARSATDAAGGRAEQYSLAKILGIWALAAAPMGILGWMSSPASCTPTPPIATGAPG